ncbi:MAG: alpha-2-macroglobulin family protein, partial [Thermoanaerobaculia bacterium]
MSKANNFQDKKENDSLDRPEKGDAVRQDGAGPDAPITLRSDFSETAFWRPNLLTDAAGTTSFEFTVPDSVTAWNVWVHALTRDLRSGSIHKETQSVKELMVRPYLPRFLREGDRADVKVVVNNASDKPLDGRVSFEILDPETNASLAAEFGLAPAAAARPFSVLPGGGTNLTFPITAPKRVGPVAFKVTAVSGDTSDGELRALPLLPGRMHLVQSRFVTLRGAARKELHFADLARNDDPTRVNDQLVVTIDAQLFYSVLQALPYLVNYPYECTEQTLNRFVSSGIVSSLYTSYPAIGKMAETLSKRETPLESWAAVDPNRKMALEETPWLEMARGGKDAGHGLTNVLDPRVAKADRDLSLAKLRKAQTSIGAFPWWPGGPPSPYMTLYIMYGLAKASEFGVDVPRDMVTRGWSYLASHYREDLRSLMKRDCCWEFLTFMNYVATCYPDASWMGDALTESERKEILAFSFKHWREHSPYLKGYLALTLKRMGRPADAQTVWASVMDSAKTNEEQGTFWAPEDRSWLWYNDTTETQAFALRTLMELSPKDPRKDGLVQWLLLDKKLNQWKSTRATAEVIYSLIHYLKQEGALGIREDATVTIGPRKVSFTFEPDVYSGGKNQIVIPGPQVDPKTMSTIVVEKQSKAFAFAS